MTYESSLLRGSLTLLNIFGASLDEKNIGNKVRLFVTLTIVSYMIFELGIFEVKLDRSDLDDMSGLTNLSVGFQVWSKTLMMLLKRKKLLALLRAIRRFWPMTKCSMILQEEIKTFYKSIKMYTKMFFVALITAGTAYSTKPLFGASRTFPMDYYHLTGRYGSPEYQVIYILQASTVALCVFFLIGFDGLFVAFIAHISCELKIIKEGFSSALVKREQSKEERMRIVKRLVNHHTLVLGCIKDLNEIYSILLLNQFFSSTMLICAGLLNVIADGLPPDMEHFSKYATFIAAFLSQLYIYCLAGTYLTQESESVSQAAYESDWWVETQPKLRRAYVMVIQRANKVEELTAGGMFALNLQTFTRVLNTSFSFFTLVQAAFSRTERK